MWLWHCYSQEDDGSYMGWELILDRSAAAGTDGDQLQLAVNCTNHRVASAATARIRPARVDADEACRLLLTAAVRQHASALFRLARWKECEQQLDARTVEKLLHLALDWPDCTAVLCKMPAAAQLRSEQVATLLLKAVQSNDDLCSLCFRSLLSLPATEELSSVCMEQLLCWAVVCGRVSPECAEMLCSKPAARALSCEAVARLLLAAAQLREGIYSYENYNVLCGLPGTAHLTSSMLAPVKQAASGRRNDRLSLMLCELPAGKDCLQALLAPYQR
jgi:hypothetical protein